jgi:hypothetical protein
MALGVAPKNFVVERSNYGLNRSSQIHEDRSRWICFCRGVETGE